MTFSCLLIKKTYYSGGCAGILILSAAAAFLQTCVIFKIRVSAKLKDKEMLLIRHDSHHTMQNKCLIQKKKDN